MATYTRWYVPECPCAHECTKASWDRTKHCGSWISEDECRQKLLNHLTRSSNHRGEDYEEMKAVAESVAIVEEQCPAEWFRG